VTPYPIFVELDGALIVRFRSGPVETRCFQCRLPLSRLCEDVCTHGQSLRRGAAWQLPASEGSLNRLRPMKRIWLFSLREHTIFLWDLEK
jgi:hypothetical protein